MKLIISLLFASLTIQTASANQDIDIFYAKVIAIDCNEDRAINTLSGTCLITIKSIEEKNADLIGLVIHTDMYWDGGKFIKADSTVQVDLGYTINKTAELKAYFPKKVSRVYFHDISVSHGGYNDVIDLQRRD